MNTENEHKEQEKYPDGTCPFKSDAKEKSPCTPDCQLHREGKNGFACVFHELATLSWNIRNNKRQ